jgi:hypothetical protein
MNASSPSPIPYCGSTVLRFAISLLLLILLNVVANPVHAQGAGCDEGVIRLPDRSGTVQICSAVAARVPELARQLAQATATLGSQDKQIAELTRLVRGLNNVSRGIGVQRQSEMLEALSAQLEAAQKARQTEILSLINERLDGLQSTLLGALSDPRMSAALGDALRGPVGEAIARLDLGAASRQIDAISAQLKAIQSSVAEVRSDTVAIRRQLDRIEQQQRNGLIDNPSGYAAHYHNARVLMQRGETDLALSSYRQVFRTGVQMADPIIDLTTLLVRQYGRQGALRALTQDFREALPASSYLYAQQLLSDRDLDEVASALFGSDEAAQSFPPLAALFVKRIQERLVRDRINRANVYTFAWSVNAKIVGLLKSLDREIGSGRYLGFYIDTIRGGRELDEFRTVSEFFRPEALLTVTVPRLSSSERLKRVDVDLSRSPVVLDHTYFVEPPADAVAGDLARRASFWPRYPAGSVFLFIWDAALDATKPVEVCAKGGAGSSCVDLNAPKLRCGAHVGERAVQCLMTRFIGSQDYFPPYVEGHFVPQTVLGQTCIASVAYTTRSGRSVKIEAAQLIGAFRRDAGQDVHETMARCGYDRPLEPPRRAESR